MSEENLERAHENIRSPNQDSYFSLSPEGAAMDTSFFEQRQNHQPISPDSSPTNIQRESLEDQNPSLLRRMSSESSISTRISRRPGSLLLAQGERLISQEDSNQHDNTQETAYNDLAPYTLKRRWEERYDTPGYFL